jgi:hypothetical protein
MRFRWPGEGLLRNRRVPVSSQQWVRPGRASVNATLASTVRDVSAGTAFDTGRLRDMASKADRENPQPHDAPQCDRWSSRNGCQRDRWLVKSRTTPARGCGEAPSSVRMFRGGLRRPVIPADHRERIQSPPKRPFTSGRHMQSDRHTGFGQGTSIPSWKTKGVDCHMARPTGHRSRHSHFPLRGLGRLYRREWVGAGIFQLLRDRLLRDSSH